MLLMWWKKYVSDESELDSRAGATANVFSKASTEHDLTLTVSSCVVSSFNWACVSMLCSGRKVLWSESRKNLHNIIIFSSNLMCFYHFHNSIFSFRLAFFFFFAFLRCFAAWITLFIPTWRDERMNASRNIRLMSMMMLMIRFSLYLWFWC